MEDLNTNLNDFIASILDHQTISKTRGALLLCACNDRFNDKEIRDFFSWFINSIMQKYSLEDEKIVLDDLKEKIHKQCFIEYANNIGYLVHKKISNKNISEYYEDTPEKAYGISEIITYYMHACSLYHDYFGNVCIPTYNFISWAIDRETIYIPKRITDWKDRQDQIMYQSNNPTQKLSKISLGRTQSATESRQEKKLVEWQAAFKIMISVALQCHTEGPKKRTRRELQAMCSRCGGNLSQAQLDFLRDCLPDEHVNKEGGAPVQGIPS